MLDCSGGDWLNEAVANAQGLHFAAAECGSPRFFVEPAKSMRDSVPTFAYFDASVSILLPMALLS